MRTWSISEARAHMSDVFDEALKNGPQKIVRRDSEPVVLVAEADWNRLIADYPTIADLILNAPMALGDGPDRRSARVVTDDRF